MRILKEYDALKNKEPLDESNSIELKFNSKSEIVLNNYLLECKKNFFMTDYESENIKFIANEIYKNVSRYVDEEEVIKVMCEYRAYYFVLVFEFLETAIPLNTLNLTSKIYEFEKFSHNHGFMEMVHIVDRVDLSVNKIDETMQLTVIFEKEYDENINFSNIVEINQEISIIKEPSIELLVDFSKKANLFCANIAEELRIPNKFVDIIKSEECKAVICADSNQNAAGGIVWYKSKSMILILNICSFIENPKCKQLLVDEIIQQAKKEEVNYIMAEINKCNILKDYFDEYNEYYYYSINNNEKITAYATKSLFGVIKEQYQELQLQREIKELQFSKDYSSPYSVIIAKIDVIEKKAMLSILWFGYDLTDNIIRHINVFSEIGIKDVYFKIDLGDASEAIIFDEIKDCGFKMKYLIPYAAQGDIVILRYEGSLTRKRKIFKVSKITKENIWAAAQVVRGVYGENYPSAYLYNEEKLYQKIRKRKIYPFIAFEEKNPVGLISIIRSAPNYYILEIGQLMVVPEYRGTSVVNELFHYMEETSRNSIEFDAIFCESVTNHKFSQRSTNSSGFSDTALKINLMASEAFKIAKEKFQVGRVACCASFREWFDEKVEIVVPKIYEEWIRFCYKDLNERIFHYGNKEFQETTTIYHIYEDEIKISQLAIYSVETIGADFQEFANGLSDYAKYNELQVIMINIPFNSESIDLAVEILNKKGFFFSGVMPYWFENTDALILQNMCGCEINWSSIQLYSKKIKQIAEFIQKDYKRISEFLE